jgi:5-methyltetrahydrofolate--homocysteine methyltransferase
MGVLLERLEERGTLISDGAWGTMLQDKGLKPGDCAEEWNLSHPDEVRQVAAAYVDAGSDMILTNTFGGSPAKLALARLEGQTDEINRAGARLSLEAAGGNALVAASIGPCGEFLEPLGSMTEQQMQAQFVRQIEPIVAAGVRALCIETLSAVEEVACCIRAARQVDGSLDICATMTFDKTPHGFRTMMGVDLKRMADALGEAGADVIGSNCGNGIEAMVELVRELRPLTDRPILVHANAGIPELIDGRTVFRQGPADFAANLPALLEAGAQIVGGCCGSTPEHIAALRTELNALGG